jgi:hypothetical protein
MIYQPPSNDYGDQIHNMTYAPYREMVDQMDAYLLAFFGTYENAQKNAHLYILETYPIEIKTEPDSNDLTFRVSMETHYRLRLKTEEELAADRSPEVS